MKPDKARLKEELERRKTGKDLLNLVVIGKWNAMEIHPGSRTLCKLHVIDIFCVLTLYTQVVDFGGSIST